jgi:hypothetical protein
VVSLFTDVPVFSRLPIIVAEVGSKPAGEGTFKRTHAVVIYREVCQLEDSLSGKGMEGHGGM